MANSDGEQKMTVSDAYKTMDEINRSIKVKGLNALEIKELKKIDGSAWMKVKADYKKWIRAMTVIADSVHSVVIGVSILGIIFFAGTIKMIAIGLLAFSGMTLYNRKGQTKGFMDGYDWGFRDGIDRALGIDDKSRRELNELAIQMEIDKGIVSRIKNKELEDQDNLIKANPNNIKAHIIRADLHLKEGRYDKAIEDCNEVIMRNPQDKGILDLVYFTRGSAYSRKNDFERAIADLSEAVKISPQNDLNYAARARIYLCSGRFEAAIEDLMVAIKINPNDANYYSDRAQAYFNRLEFDKSWVDVHRVEELGQQVNAGFLEQLKNDSRREN